MLHAECEGKNFMVFVKLTSQLNRKSFAKFIMIVANIIFSQTSIEKKIVKAAKTVGKESREGQEDKY